MDENSPKNAYISPPEKIADGVVVRMLLEDLVPRIQMVLVIDEYTSFDSINKNRKDIKYLLKSLESSQGSDLKIKYRGDLFGLIQWREEGISWGKLTMILNYLGIALIYASYDESHNMVKPKMKLGESQDIIGDPRFLASFGGVGLIFIFLSLGMTFEDFNFWMEQRYKNLDEDRLYLGITDGPFNKQQVRDKVRYFQNCIKAGQITISKDDLPWNELEHTTYILIQKGYFTKLDELLDKEGLKDWKRNKPFIQSWVVRISEKWADSKDPKIIKMREIYKNMGKN